VITLASSRLNSANSRLAFSRTIPNISIVQAWNRCEKGIVTSGHERRRSLYDTRAEWHGDRVNAIRELRCREGFSQREFAALIDVPVNTFRMWDSGLRRAPAPALTHAREALAHRARQNTLLPLNQLARELHVHVRTLQAAARTGRLEVCVCGRTGLGRQPWLATRASADAFMRTHYRKFSGQAPGIFAPTRLVPPDYSRQLRQLRQHLRLSQSSFAVKIGAANKAVIYQWESGKRTPSPLFWERVELLQRALRRATAIPAASTASSDLSRPNTRVRRPGRHPNATDPAASGGRFRPRSCLAY
jgi:DNA-binding transcriptional regulator YiaG